MCSRTRYSSVMWRRFRAEWIPTLLWNHYIHWPREGSLEEIAKQVLTELKAGG